ncbi:ketopantoate reductase family protein [Clostridium sp.]|uniref:ketopantoate reductase family protein n=1 Tax=Clostridium sp. TaxID=1506 RepID=UPI00260536DB|nr:2-dehydropantoate 2-reductase N-terminal domain-containing protein [Clostridium sp.]
MRILVYGAGVIGCELAHELCKGENYVTILARGNWKRSIDKNGMVIRHYGQLRTTTDHIKTIETLEADDNYDLIFVVMQYNQVLDIIPQLSENISRYIVFVGNNMNPSHCREQICSQSATEKEIAFGFQGTGGRRENGKVISMHFIKVPMTVGGLIEHLTAEFTKRIITTFEKTGYQLTWEEHMEGWLISHVAHILPTAYICYSLDCNLKRASKEKINLVIDAIVEAHKMLKKLGYPIRPDGEEEAFIKNRKKKQIMLYLMVKTPAGKFVISNHCANAVGEMIALDREFEKLQIKADMHMPAWDKLRKDAMMVLNNK